MGKVVKVTANILTSRRECLTNQSAESMGTEWSNSHQHQPQASSFSMTIVDNVVRNSIMYVYMSNQFFSPAS
jgi:hypothetical protein